MSRSVAGLDTAARPGSSATARLVDGPKPGRIQGRPAHEDTGDAGHGHDLGGVIGLDRAAVKDGDAARTQCRELAPDRGMALGDVGRGGRAARADRPDRLVGDDGIVGRGTLGPAAGELVLEHLYRLARLPLRLGLADAQDDEQARRQPGRGLGPDHGVGLAQAMAALGMADQHGVGAGVLEHRRADRARERTLGLGVAVLAPDHDARAICQRRRSRPER